MAKYEYDLANKKDLSLLLDRYDKLKVYESRDFKEFIANKCKEELLDIGNYTLVTFDEHSVFDAKVREYEANHRRRMGPGYLEIYNDTTLNVDEMFWVSDKTIMNYIMGISIAKIIEYGTGLKGTSQSDWQTNVNHYPHGWHYTNPDTWEGTYTNGLEGRFIYLKLTDAIAKNFGDWYKEYMRTRKED